MDSTNVLFDNFYYYYPHIQILQIIKSTKSQTKLRDECDNYTMYLTPSPRYPITSITTINPHI